MSKRNRSVRQLELDPRSKRSTIEVEASHRLVQLEASMPKRGGPNACSGPRDRLLIPSHRNGVATRVARRGQSRTSLHGSPVHRELRRADSRDQTREGRLVLGHPRRIAEAAVLHSSIKLGQRAFQLVTM